MQGILGAMKLTVAALALALVLFVLAGCTSRSTAPPAESTAATVAPTPAPAGPGAAATPTRPSTGSATGSTPSPPSAPTATPRPKSKPNPISMDALIQKTYDGRDLKLGRRLGDFGAYKRYLITYRGDGETISGVMNVPDGKGPFPVLVLNHGYIDPDVYVLGQGMRREQDYLARQGYVALHVDYRGHATSSNDPDVDYELRLPYAVDSINAVQAVKASSLEFLDGDRVGWLGRSMGGEVTLRALAAQPGLVDAAVIYASTSSLTADNYNQFSRDDPDRRATGRKIDETYGLPNENPDFWRAASARPYFDRVTEPLFFLHGTEDDTCPIAWSRDTVRALEAVGAEVTLKEYAGEGHRFEGQFDDSIKRTADFFADHLT